MAPREKGECGDVEEGGCSVGGLQWQRLNWEKQGAGIVLSSPL